MPPGVPAHSGDYTQALLSGRSTKAGTVIPATRLHYRETNDGFERRPGP